MKNYLEGFGSPWHKLKPEDKKHKKEETEVG
jgi:hypothetical protein